MTAVSRPLLCVGALTGDLMLRVPHLPVGGGKLMAEDATLVAAGMASSAATAAARLGFPVALWASAGQDAIGDFILAEIAREGIDVSLVRRLADVPSATAMILVDGEGERLVVPYYAPGLLDEPESVPDLGGFSAVLADVRWPKAAALALARAREAGIPAILDCDVGSPDILQGLAALATHIVASRAGAALLTGLDRAGESAARLVGTRDAVVVVTDGANGVFRGDGGTVRHSPAFPVEAIDTNAAGDIFHGAFAVGVASGLPLEDTIRLASAAAAIKCTRPGGRMGAPTRGEVEIFLAQNSRIQRGAA